MIAKMKGKHVLVTGAGGFIGSHLVERLISEGARVRAFVHYNSRRDPGLLCHLPPAVFSQVELVAGDLHDAAAVQSAVDGSEIVFHLGALISIPYSYYHPVEVAYTNFIGTLNVLMACRQSKVQRLIHTSTSEVYGTARQVPISEAHPLQGQSPYSASKIGADKLAESFYCTYDLPVVTIRPFNTFGPRQSARAVIPTIISQVLTRSTVHLGSLETKRDFTYVEDTVSGFLAAALCRDVCGKTYNLGTGREICIGDLADLIIDKIGKTVKIKIDQERLRPNKSEVMELISDFAQARADLNWQPLITLDQGLDETIKSISHHLDLYLPAKYQF
jgi:NAD dependent epimerase/dehydratase